jgi:predicted esterase YcpF (UPF0227 family)
MRPAHLIYLHGFRSSPRSTKARRLAAWMAAHRPDIGWHAPQLPPSPGETAALLDALIERLQADGPVVLAGSSLGGFYATVMAERHGLRAVVINPAVQPARDLAAYIGELTQWHDPDERFFFRPEYVDELRALTPATLAQPGHILALIAQGDEVLDWREMQARYQAGPVQLIPGSDHALSDFDHHLPDLLTFLELTP